MEHVGGDGGDCFALNELNPTWRVCLEAISTWEGEDASVEKKKVDSRDLFVLDA